MTDTESARWQALSALPEVARAIGEQYDNTRELYEHLCAGRDQPHLLDDALIERVLRHVRDQLEFLPVYREQLSRWYQLQPTATEFIQLDRLTHHLDRWDELLKQQRTLAEELSTGTIDKMMALSEEELAMGLLNGKIPFPKTTDANRELVAATRVQLATVLDLAFQEVEAAERDDLGKLGGMRHCMAGFKQLMDSTDRVEFQAIVKQFPALYRFAQLLERIAAGIQSGQIQVPP